MTIKHLQHVGKRALPWLIITLAALIALPQPAQAAPGDLVFTIEAPGVQVSQVTCETPTVETFDQAAPGFAPSLSVPIGEMQPAAHNLKSGPLISSVAQAVAASTSSYRD